MKPEHTPSWKEAQDELDRLLGLPSAPESLEPGQLWTVFLPDEEQNNDMDDEPGIILLIRYVEDNRITVIPADTTSDVRTFIEPVLSGPLLDTGDPQGIIVPVLHLENTVPSLAFKNARYLGRVKPEGMGQVHEALHKLQRAQEGKSALPRARELTAEEMENAVSHGVFLDYPMGPVEDWDKRNRELSRILSHWILKERVPEHKQYKDGLPVTVISLSDFKKRKALFYESSKEPLAAAPSGLLRVMDVFRDQDQTHKKTISLNSGDVPLEILIQGSEIQLILHQNVQGSLPELWWFGPDKSLHALTFQNKPGSNQWVADQTLPLPATLKTLEEWISIEP